MEGSQPEVGLQNQVEVRVPWDVVEIMLGLLISVIIPFGTASLIFMLFRIYTI